MMNDKSQPGAGDTSPASACSAALPKSLQAYVDFIARANRPCEFQEVVTVTPGRNYFRRLVARGLVENIVRGYTRFDEPYTGPRMSKYILTEKGWQHVNPQNTKLQ